MYHALFNLAFLVEDLLFEAVAEFCVTCILFLLFVLDSMCFLVNFLQEGFTQSSLELRRFQLL